jgi:hypothetical protein
MTRFSTRFLSFAALVIGCSSPSSRTPGNASAGAPRQTSSESSPSDGTPVWEDGDTALTISESGGNDPYVVPGECTGDTVSWTYEAVPGVLKKSGCENGFSVAKSLSLDAARRTQIENALRALQTTPGSLPVGAAGWIVDGAAVDEVPLCQYDAPVDTMSVTDATGGARHFTSVPWCGDTPKVPIISTLFDVSNLFDSIAGCPGGKGEWCVNCPCATGLACEKDDGGGSPYCHPM